MAEPDLQKAIAELQGIPVDVILKRGISIKCNLSLERSVFKRLTGVVAIFQNEIRPRINFPGRKSYEFGVLKKGNKIAIIICGIDFFVIKLNLYDWDNYNLISKMINDKIALIQDQIDALCKKVSVRVSELEKEENYAAYTILYHYYKNSQDYKKAFHYLRRLEPFRVDIYLYDLAEAYLNGRGCEKNEAMGYYYHKLNLSIIKGGDYEYMRVPTDSDMGDRYKWQDKLYRNAYLKGRHNKGCF